MVTVARTNIQLGYRARETKLTFIVAEEKLQTLLKFMNDIKKKKFRLIKNNLIFLCLNCVTGKNEKKQK